MADETRSGGDTRTPPPNPSQPPQPPQQGQQFAMDTGSISTVYTNFCHVTFLPEELILDFGLSTELLPQHAGDGSYLMAGTPAYMSPEEGSGATPSEGSDWYAVGVTLYEALTGTLPFAGSALDVLDRKRTSDPPTPVEVAPDIPADLSAICMGLLCRSPEQRLTGR